jgi:predicted RNA-binding protein with PIN domain
VKIFYARRNSDADTRIKNLVESSKERRTLIVVTSDRALAHYCRRCAAPVLSSKDFLHKIVEAEQQDLEKTRLEGVKSEEIDDWMRYFGVDKND